jgi:D-cysteine desulfhydrase
MGDIPKSLQYTSTMTPIIQLEQYDDYQVWLKRDDMTGIEVSGNKIRKLDFLIQDALSHGAEGIITCGGLQSNHCRTTAYVCAKLGLSAELFLRGTPERFPTGNYLMNLLCGANISFVSPNEYRDIDNIMKKKAAADAAQGKTMYIIPEGGSNEIGAWGYYQCFTEILEQIKNNKLPLEAIVVASGSGGTHAGLLIGKLLHKSELEIFSINVCDDADFFRNKIFHVIAKFKAKYGYEFDLKKKDIHIVDGFVGAGYGLIGAQEVSLIKRMAKYHGILFDPVYTAKAYLGLEYLIKKEIITYHNILFIHTGGIFGIFPLADQLV